MRSFKIHTLTKNKTKKAKALTLCDLSELEPYVMQVDELEPYVVQVDELEPYVMQIDELESLVMHQAGKRVGGRSKSLQSRQK